MTKENTNLRNCSNEQCADRRLIPHKITYRTKEATMSDKLNTKQLHSPRKNDVLETSIEKEYRLNELLDLWIKNNCIRYKGATEAKYRYLITTHINPQLGECRLNQLSAPMINSFLQQKLENGRIDGGGGLSPAYVRSMMLILNAAITFAVEEELCKPMKSAIYKPVPVKHEMQILTIQQQRQIELYIYQNLDNTGIGVLLSLYTGLRLGEICALKWTDLDFEKKIIHVCRTVSRTTDSHSTKSKLIVDTPKTPSSVRTIPIPSKLLPIMLSSKNSSTSSYVFSSEKNFLNPRTLEYRYTKLLQKTGINHINFHTLRHTFATRCIEAGVDVKSLSEMLGHSNVGITLNTYVHSSIELKRVQLEKLMTVL